MIWKVRDRVVRPRTVGGSDFRRGVVVEVYAPASRGVSGFIDYLLYAVRWDETGRVERGYLACGLQQEPLQLTRALFS